MPRIYQFLALLYRPTKDTIMRPVTKDGHYYTAKLAQLRIALAAVTKAPNL
jgi:hypothetical protein